MSWRTWAGSTRSGLPVSGLAGWGLTAFVVLAVDSPAARLAVLATLMCLAGWWWGSARLDAIDRSPLSAKVGRSGRAVVVVTAPRRSAAYDIRAQGRSRSFDGKPVREPVQLDFKLGRSPPLGAVIAALVVGSASPGPEHGFDERLWLRRHGVHVVFRVDEWSRIGARGGLSGAADRLRRRLARSIAPGLDGERRSVLEGIVLGEGPRSRRLCGRTFRPPASTTSSP